MALLEVLTEASIAEEIRSAARDGIPVTITARRREDWDVLDSRLVGLENGHVVAALADRTGPPGGLGAGDEVGLSYKRRNYKYLCSCVLEGVGSLPVAEGQELPALWLAYPRQMHRLDRRAYKRSRVPESSPAVVTFWPGGLEAALSEDSPIAPNWRGRLRSLGAGGLQLLAEAGTCEAVKPGEVIGVRIGFGEGGEQVAINAQFRYARAAEGQLVVGLQFAGLTLTPEGRGTLGVIVEKVRQYAGASDEAARAGG
jgi:hypothetical protein